MLGSLILRGDSLMARLAFGAVLLIACSSCRPAAVRPNYELQRDAMSSLAKGIAEKQLPKQSGTACSLLDLTGADGSHRSSPLQACWRDVLENTILDRGLFVVERDPAILVALIDESAPKTFERRVRVNELVNAKELVAETVSPNDSKAVEEATRVAAPLASVAVTDVDSSLRSTKPVQLQSAAFVIAYRLYDAGVQYSPSRTGYVRRRAEVKAYAKFIDPETGRVIWADYLVGEAEDEIPRRAIRFAERSPLNGFSPPMPTLRRDEARTDAKFELTPTTRSAAPSTSALPVHAPATAIPKAGGTKLHFDASVGFAQPIYAYEKLRGPGVSAAIRSRYDFVFASVRGETTRSRYAAIPEVGVRIPVLDLGAVFASGGVGYAEYRYKPNGDPSQTIRARVPMGTGSVGAEAVIGSSIGVRAAVAYEQANDAWVTYSPGEETISDLPLALLRLDVTYGF